MKHSLLPYLVSLPLIFLSSFFFFFFSVVFDHIFSLILVFWPFFHIFCITLSSLSSLSQQSVFSVLSFFSLFQSCFPSVFSLSSSSFSFSSPIILFLFLSQFPSVSVYPFSETIAATRGQEVHPASSGPSLSLPSLLKGLSPVWPPAFGGVLSFSFGLVDFF